MAVRLAVGLSLTAFMFVELYFVPTWVLALSISVLSVMSVLELLWFSGYIKNFVLIMVASLSAFLIPIWSYLNLPQVMIYFALFLLIVLLFVVSMASKKRRIPFDKLCAALFGATVIPWFLSAISRIAETPDGRFVLLLPFIAAFATDTFAYYFGMAIGRHKLAPVISPKKTLEGAIAGVIGSVLVAVIYGLIVAFFFKCNVNYLMVMLFVAAGSILSQCGDLSMSFIKRGFQIKDFGSIFPGHGGILDRCDSLLFAAPAFEIMLRLTTVVTQ